MPIPSFQDLMLPLLEECNDDKDHNGKELSEILAKRFNLSEEEKNLRLNNTKQTKFGNTVSWAQSHLKAATLLTRTSGKNFKITDYGQEILKRRPRRIDINYLRTLPEYLEALKGKENAVIEESKPEETSTPQEMIEKGYQKIRKSLDNEIIEQIKSSLPAFFESIVIDLLLKMGYGGTLEDAGQALGRSSDEGIDGIIKEDRLGFEIIYIQAKRWENPVGRPEIQKFVGALHGQHAKKGLFITTSRFSNEAIEYVKNIDVKVILVDGEKLSELMIDYGLGLSIEKTYNIYRIDTDYFQESI